MKTKRRTKERYEKIGFLFKKLAETNFLNSVPRIIKATKRMNAVLKDMNDRLNKNPEYLKRGFMPESPTVLLKLCPWYKDQEIIRVSLIQSHPSFCCAVTGEILDCRDSFILKGGVYSRKGVNRLLEKHGLDLLRCIET
jgi:hypothetical protein